MSHVATIDLQIKDLESLKKAATRVGLEFVEGQSTYKWYGRHMGDYSVPEGFTKEDLGKCDHVLKVRGNNQAYEVGVVYRDGEYKLLWDFWSKGFGLEECVGKEGGLLKQAYAVETAKRQAIRDGFRVSEIQKEDGSVVLRAYQ